MKWLMAICVFLTILLINGCAAKKVVAKDCEQAAQSGIFVCSPL